MKNKIRLAKKLSSSLLLVTLLSLSLVSFADLKIANLSQITVGFSATDPEPNNTSGSPAIAPNGRYLVFRSAANNLINDAGPNFDQVYLKDLNKGLLSRASVNSSGQAAAGSSDQPAISYLNQDGNFAIAFRSNASNLGSINLSSGNNNVFVRFPLQGVTEILSRSTISTEANGDSSDPSVAVNDNKVTVAFTSSADNLILSDTNKKRDIFYTTFSLPKKNGSINPTALARMNTSKDGLDIDGDCGSAKISGDGLFAVFSCDASNMSSPPSPLGTSQIYLFNFKTKSTSLISKTASSEAGNGNSSEPKINYNGRYIAYLTQASNISGDNSGNTRVVLYDRIKNATVLLDNTSNGTSPSGAASQLSISPDGRFISFAHTANDLIVGDTNSVSDIFIRDLNLSSLQRVSVTSSGLEANDNSDLPTLNTQGFNANSSLLSFRTFATNLAPDSFASTASRGSIFAQSLIFPAPLLTKDTALEVPPAIKTSKAQIKLTLQKFSGVAVASAAILNNQISSRAANSPTINYEIRVENQKRKNDRKTITSRRNQVTVKNVRPGTYSARYRTIVKSGNKTIRKTGFSPKQTIKVK